MKPVLTLVANATVAKIVNADDTVKQIIATALSYRVEGCEHMHAFTSGGWDGRSSFFTHKTCTFPAGFFHMIFHELTRKGYQVRIARKPFATPLGPENPIVDKFGNDDPRYDFQLKALRQVEKHGRGIIQVATGGGKSKIAKLITSRYRRPTLFLTTRGVLMYQMQKAFLKDCGFNTGLIGDGIWSPTKGINCGMVQTFVAQLKAPKLEDEKGKVIGENIKKELGLDDKQIAALAQTRFDEKTKTRARLIKFLELIEVVIGEEAHEAGGNSYFEILQYCKNATVRVALTATPFMRSAEEDNMRLMAAFGPILIKVSEELLIKRGVLAKPYFQYRSPPPAKLLRRTSPWQRAREIGITTSLPRNTDIVSMTVKAKAHGLPVLILVAAKKHGPFLVEMLRAKGVRCQQIQGENDQAEREGALEALANGGIDCLIGTTIVDVGVDVPSIGLVILAGGGKGEIPLRQRIGRGLRAKKSGPNVTFIVDYTDELNSTLRDHARTRRAIVEQTPGFAEGIIPAGQDLPWHLFSMRKAA
ncbi:DEAD/DEAH box helicase [Bradyrhizobium sp. 179]|uniref:DEAD/DEAH box helicase n=1 Tax=Bradyrhizobium sp. 179 TaxID=2782648 RepID=UPI001FF8A55C|nr:DEAD/DEAH box helicase [Bradyrhizobium sp. 179]MCK1543401.1 DEAD/DEAH box helicase [Bradyrhizobium sp. 179]